MTPGGLLSSAGRFWQSGAPLPPDNADDGSFTTCRQEFVGK